MSTPLAQELAGLDFSAISPEEFAGIVKGRSGKEIGEVMRGELRARIIDAVFARTGDRFRPEAAGSLRALVRWKITGGEGEETVYETDIADGVCEVRAGRGDGTPRTTLTMGDAEFLKLFSGNTSPITLFMTRRLKVAGDVALASGLARYFDIPKP
ncbi:SCP2 sterol-binding domain-containing protein [Phaeacidiphilus oryzae]|uniref:SCP2 sterol-binding domain-containing protein n=1 Tax=Phaeacidiphilus oryzae TaxID=348818 RepID=UPI000560A2BE|nr:SCP2 sterol-binding domain-containing protein [Phaeacidiphilus oryzae]